MSTDLANLGPSLMRTPDLGAKDLKRDQLLTPKSGTDGAETFAKTLNEKVRDKVEEKRWQSSETRGAPEKKSTRSAERAEKSEGAEDKGDNTTDAKETVRKTAKDGKEAKKASKSVTREQAMLEFMDSMESELGIPPAEMLEAMANLSEGDQLLPPEATASKVISQLATDLELSPEDQEKAMALYSELLANINQQPLPQAQALPELGTSHELVTKNALSGKDKRQILNDSLDRLNQKFFMQEIRGQGTADKLMTLPVDKAGDLQLPPQMQNQLSNEALMRSELPNLDLSQVQMPQEMQAAPSENGGYGDLAKSLAALGIATKSLEGALPKNVQSMAQEGSPVVQPQMNLMQQMPSVQTQLSGQQSGDGMASFADQELSSEEDALKIGESTGHEFRMPELMGHADRSRLDSSMGLGAGIGGATAGATAKTQAEPNVQQLMNQANYLVKKGGGEASIILNPEGLGKVHLKVAINEGKVDLQMKAETTEAKKLLESSLGDLKSGLAAQRLNLDQVRVDVGNQASSNHDNRHSQQQNQPSYDQAREQARQFFGQFREDNSGKREGVWESPGIRSYGRARRINPLDPAPVEEKRIAREVGANRGKGLDLVA